MVKWSLDDCTQTALDLTERLCRHPSVSAQRHALDETTDLVETLVNDAGFITQRLVGERGLAVARVRVLRR
jgi:hypothetical protein